MTDEANGAGASPAQVQNFRGRVEAWAERADVTVPELEVTSERVVCAAIPSGQGVTLYANQHLLAASTKVQDSILAHEMAHISLGHMTTNPRRGRLALLAAIAGLLAVVVAVVGFVASATPVAVAGLAVLVACVIILGVVLAPARRREFEADRLAAERFGHVFDGELSAWLKAAGASDPGWVWDLLTTHPSHRRRVRAVRRFMKSSEEKA